MEHADQINRTRAQSPGIDFDELSRVAIPGLWSATSCNTVQRAATKQSNVQNEANGTFRRATMPQDAPGCPKMPRNARTCRSKNAERTQMAHSGARAKRNPGLSTGAAR